MHVCVYNVGAFVHVRYNFLLLSVIHSWSYGWKKSVSSQRSVTFDLKLCPVIIIVLWEYLLTCVNPSHKILLPLNMPSRSYGWKMSLTFEIWPWENLSNIQPAIYTSYSISKPSTNKIQSWVFLKLREWDLGYIDRWTDNPKNLPHSPIRGGGIKE